MSNRVVFCPDCHRHTAIIKKDEEGIKIIQGGRVMLSLGKGNKMNGFTLNCPVGHPVKIEV